MKGRTYRYLDREPLYPFGYGLNYGDTFCKEAFLAKTDDGTVEIHAKVVNDGEREAADVLQVYVKNLDSLMAVPNHSLCGMKPFTLHAKETQEIVLKIENAAFTVVDEHGMRRRDGRNFIIFAGCSQPDARSVSLTEHRPIELTYVRRD